MTKIYWQITVAVLFTVLCFLQYRLWYQKNGLYDMFALKEKLALQLNENKKLQQENTNLLERVKLLQLNTKAAIETQARNDLGMVKKGETFYQIVNEPNQ